MNDTRKLKVIVVGNAKSAQQAVRGLSDDTSRAGSKVGAVGSRIGGSLAALGRGASLAFGAAAAGTAMVGIKAAASAEQNQMAMTTILGSSRKAKRFLQDISDFAAKTPFDLPTLTDAGKRLTAVGTKTRDVIPLMEALGDATSGMGTGAEGIQRSVTALTQMRTKGKVSAEDMMQLAEAGVPVWDALAGKIGKSTGAVQGMVTKGKVSVDTLFSAIQEKQGKVFGKLDGMMDKQSQTVSGMWSTLKDTFEQGAGKIMSAFWPIIKDAMPGITKGVGIAADAISGLTHHLGPVKRIVKDVAGAVGGFFKGLKGGGKSSALTKTFDTLRKFGSEIMPVLKDFGDKLAKTIGPAISDIGNLIKTDLLPAFNRFLPVITPVVKILLKMFGDSVIGAIQGAVGVIKGFIKVISGIMDVISGIFTGDWSRVWGGLKKIVSGALQGILGLVKVWLNVGIINVFRKGFVFLTKGIWVKGWAALKGLGKKGLSGIGDVLKKVGDILTKPFRSAFSWLKGIIARGWAAEKALFRNAIFAVGRTLANVRETITAPFRRAFDLLRTVVTNGVERFIRGWGRIFSFLGRLPGRVTDVFKNAASWLLSAGKDILRGLLNGLGAGKQWIIDKVAELANLIPSGLKRLLGIQSPSRVTKALGRWAARGLAEGVADKGELARLRKATLAVGHEVAKSFASGLHSAKNARLMDKAIRAIQRKIIGAWQDRKISSAGAQRLINLVGDMDARADRLVTRRLRLAKRLNDAQEELNKRQQRLADLRGEYKSLSEGVRDNSRGFGSIVAALAGEGEPNTAAYIMSRMQDKLVAIRDFRKNLKSLITRGLSRSLVQQIAEAGPDQGGLIASALVRGTAADINSFNGIDSAIGRESSALGTMTAGKVYGQAIRHAEASVNREARVVNHINIEVKGTVKTERELIEIVRDGIARANKRNGGKQIGR